MNSPNIAKHVAAIIALALVIAFLSAVIISITPDAQVSLHLNQIIETCLILVLLTIGRPK
jgi:hypothetical protein